MSLNVSGKANLYPVDDDLQQHHVSVHQTGLVWKEMAKVDEKQAGGGDSFYLLCSSKIQEETDEQIKKDVTRTFPYLSYLQVHETKWTLGHANLHKVLYAYAAYDPEIGYCQGMNFLAALPLYFMPPDEAFWVLCHQMQSPNLLWREYYLPGFPKLHASLECFQYLTKTLIPDLHEHLQKEDAQITVIATQWFLTAFAYSTTAHNIALLWNHLFVEGHDVMFTMAISILQIEKNKFLSKNGTQLQEFTFTFTLSSEVFCQVLKNMDNQLKFTREAIAKFNQSKNLLKKEAGGSSRQSTKFALFSRASISNIFNSVYEKIRAQAQQQQVQPQTQQFTSIQQQQQQVQSQPQQTLQQALQQQQPQPQQAHVLMGTAYPRAEVVAILDNKNYNNNNNNNNNNSISVTAYPVTSATNSQVITAKPYYPTNDQTTRPSSLYP